MRRRILLALAGTTLAAGAGCVTDRSSDDDGRGSGQCGDVAIESARVTVDHVCDYGPTTDAEITGSALECDGTLTVELRQGEAVVEERAVDADAEWTTRFELDAPIDPGEATVRVRGPDPAVAAERTVAVEHYRDAPHLSVWTPSVDPETVRVGEPVTVALTVGNVGGDGAFTAEIVVDGAAVASQDGTVTGATDCDQPSGPELSLSHAFDEAGEYGTGVALRATDPDGSGGDVDLGTVTVQA